MENQKVVLITGASSGFGYGIAKHFASQGHIVYATAEKMDGLETLEQYGAITRKLDVQSQEDVDTVVAEIIQQQHRIDIVYNNAGYGLFGSVETISMKTVQKQFDINVFGVERINKAVLPHMRKARQGRMIVTESTVAEVVSPFSGWYSSSKHALRAITSALREEVRDLGIQIVSIRPGIVKTSFMSNTVLERNKDSDDYKVLEESFWKKLTYVYTNTNETSESTINQMIKAGLIKKPRSVYHTTWDAKVLDYLSRLVSTETLANICLRIMKRYP